ncbi:MAG TPA: methyltransferase domain-containing protein [Solirubrobacteraceae bacterium]|jgi:trans-aconitate 2-methyltransferase
MTPRDWNAATYERVSAPLEAMGRDVAWRLALRGDETVLDAGCGTGRVTAALLERLPEGRVIAVDGSPSMIEQAEARLGGRADLRVVDLLELEVEEPVDAILSTATFHWIADHDRLFARLHAALWPGGQLVAQCGGAGNVAAVKEAGRVIGRREPFAAHLRGWAEDWNFQTPEATRERLLATGFADVWCWTNRVRVEPDDAEGYLGAICLGSFLERLPHELHEAFVDAALEELPHPLHIDYVRLNILARRPV